MFLLSQKKYIQSNQKFHVTYTYYVIYSIECKKCNLQYVGQTIQPVYKRFLNHFYDVLNKKIEEPVPAHFVNSRNHSIHDMIFTSFEKLYKKDKTLLDVRENFLDCLKQNFQQMV